MVVGCGLFAPKPITLDQLTAKYTNSYSNFVKINGADIHYRVESANSHPKPTLILLHGVAASLHTWDGWVAEMAEHFQIIRLDLPGFGLTGPVLGREQYEIDYLVDTLEQFVVSLEIDSFYLAGNSLGGYIAWNYTVQNSNRVDKLILLDSAGFKQTLPFGMWLASLPGLGEITGHVPRSIVEGGLKKAYGDDSKVTERLVDQYYEIAQRPGNRAAYVQYFKQMRRDHDDNKLGDKVKNVKIPTLIMWGKKDTIVPLSVFRQFKRAIPHAKVRLYPGVGHLPMEEIPSKSAKDAIKFLLGS